MRLLNAGSELVQAYSFQPCKHNLWSEVCAAQRSPKFRTRGGERAGQEGQGGDAALVEQPANPCR